MSKKVTLKLAATLLTFAALLHLVRVLAGWDMVINGWLLPVWVSILVVLLAGYLGFRVCTMEKK
ncbi:MAG: hypothetical protein HOJ15_00320 [Candidatus Jacksonbacteria bacterium]|jgi:hypothetical protein|nr:hypothetical protein [Candidatus Jacksonbacteria bacterium]MBT6300857.1 hypothetical protein [Candidatus Jacksonbacteria bacterium]MBT6757509.1 hypothetical protein [Candidatus Jacksonbacteria bacterium]MBT6955136.1 hypothetical protein [Candidatus Jacksonbacteria bacterium]MBT7007880.1 hypothetical protein [Candidatus Jacksonbacteria bacterium]